MVLQTWKQLPSYWVTSLRSCLIGCWMGITPGGATPASFMSYGLAKRFSRNGAKFGTGEIEGVVAPETAAHAAGTSALLPMLTLGIPGSPTAAVLLGGLLIWGLQPGPLLFVEQKEFVWGLIASMYLGNIVGLIVVLTTVPLFAAILRIPFSIIAPVIIVICAVGAYTVHNACLDIVGDAGVRRARLHLQEARYPLAPLVLALVLGDMAESSFRQAMLLSQGDLSDLLVEPAGRHHRDAGPGRPVLAGDLDPPQPPLRAAQPRLIIKAAELRPLANTDDRRLFADGFLVRLKRGGLLFAPRPTSETAARCTLTAHSEAGNCGTIGVSVCALHRIGPRKM